MSIRSVLAAAFLVASLAGCASFGEKFDPALIDQLQPGVSTVQDAVALLGPYSGESMGASGVHVYTWMHSEANALTGKSAAQSVGLAFGPDGKLVNKTRNATQGQF